MADQNLNVTSPGALNQGNPPSLSPPLSPAPATPSTAQSVAPPPTTSDGVVTPPTTTTANTGPTAGVMGRASTGAPAQPAGEGLAQGGNTIVINVSGGGSGGSGETLAAVQVADFTAAVSTIYPCDPGAGNINATLPLGSGVVGAQITPIEIYNNSNDVGTVTVLPSGGDTVAGQTELVLQPQQSVRLVWDGVSNWMTAP
jgi:hypothetical protein